jgi:hypothetical protein
VTEYPELLHTVLDTTEPRALAEFYRQLLGLRYRDGDEPPSDGSVDNPGWLVLTDAAGTRKLAFQRVDELPRTTWPRHDVPMQLHCDFTVSGLAACGGSGSGPRRSARNSCSTAPTTPTSRSTSSPT